MKRDSAALSTPKPSAPLVAGLVLAIVAILVFDLRRTTPDLALSWGALAPWVVELLGAGVGFACGVAAILGLQLVAPSARICGAQGTRTLSVEEIESSGKRLSAQLADAIGDFERHKDSTGRYAKALNQGHSRLADANDPNLIRSVTLFLLQENEKMERANTSYQRQLEDSSRQLEALRAELAHTKEQSERDALTNLYSRRYFDEALARHVAKAQRDLRDLSLIMADLDHFKAINDTHGHLIGDDLLKKFASLLVEHASDVDCVARFGGEEFAIIMPTASLHGASSLAERLRKKLESARWKKKDGDPIGLVTASFGVAQLKLNETPTSLIERADAKLYESKRAGRNRISR